MTNKDFFAALEDLEREKGISRQIFIDALQNALVAAYKKHTGDPSEIVVKMDEEKHTINFYSVKTVVETEEEVEDEEKQIWIEDALEVSPKAKVGDVLKKEFVPKDFGRIAAQTARQVVMQKLREAERDNTLSAFSDKEDELMTCLIRRIENKNVYVDLGQGEIEGVMLPQDQTPGETYNVNDRLKVYVKRVRSMGRNAQVLVSRSSAGLVKRLFENEVPEIRQGFVQVKSVAREPGQRTKIAIYSEDSRIDPVGACVGNKGSRVNAIVSELGGEKIDIILWSENPLEFIAKALSPAKVQKVIMLSETQKAARVVVSDDVLSLAIGRDGQNARLAARLTGWKVDVKSESYMQEHEAELAEKDLEKYGVDIPVEAADSEEEIAE
ncbi:MAG: transcription termination/antitermination protein NusA [Clostridia bacterium]|nr:transcription termination/antitermination protein NusA [Clostridia bacterium]MBQ5801930.1 transcription termination/antitermination protein NusA [Clostridia bacterium]